MLQVVIALELRLVVDNRISKWVLTMAQHGNDLTSEFIQISVRKAETDKQDCAACQHTPEERRVSRVSMKQPTAATGHCHSLEDTLRATCGSLRWSRRQILHSPSFHEFESLASRLACTRGQSLLSMPQRT